MTTAERGRCEDGFNSLAGEAWFCRRSSTVSTLDGGGATLDALGELRMLNVFDSRLADSCRVGDCVVCDCLAACPSCWLDDGCVATIMSSSSSTGMLAGTLLLDAAYGLKKSAIDRPIGIASRRADVEHCALVYYCQQTSTERAAG